MYLGRLLRLPLLLSLAATLLCLPAAYGETTAADPADPSTAAPVSDSAPQQIEEVSVEAHRLKMFRLRIQINKAVDNFYDLFNKYNGEPEYETHCSDERRSTGYTVQHVCRARFVNDANEQAVQGLFYHYATIPAFALIYVRSRGYKQRLEELIHINPEVRQAAAEFDALTLQYQTTSREKVKAP
jgi:hypothetical protein